MDHGGLFYFHLLRKTFKMKRSLKSGIPNTLFKNINLRFNSVEMPTYHTYYTGILIETMKAIKGREQNASIMGANSSKICSVSYNSCI